MFPLQAATVTVPRKFVVRDGSDAAMHFPGGRVDAPCQKGASVSGRELHLPRPCPLRFRYWCTVREEDGRSDERGPYDDRLRISHVVLHA